MSCACCGCCDCDCCVGTIDYNLDYLTSATQILPQINNSLATNRTLGFPEALSHENNVLFEMDENEEAKASDDESRHFKEVDKRIMKEQLFAQPDFGRDELMRLFGVDKNT